MLPRIHTAEVTGSIPVSPTIYLENSTGLFLIAGAASAAIGVLIGPEGPPCILLLLLGRPGAASALHRVKEFLVGLGFLHFAQQEFDGCQLVHRVQQLA